MNSDDIKGQIFLRLLSLQSVRAKTSYHYDGDSETEIHSKETQWTPLVKYARFLEPGSDVEILDYHNRLYQREPGESWSQSEPVTLSLVGATMWTDILPIPLDSVSELQLADDNQTTDDAVEHFTGIVGGSSTTVTDMAPTGTIDLWVDTRSWLIHRMVLRMPTLQDDRAVVWSTIITALSDFDSPMEFPPEPVP